MTSSPSGDAGRGAPATAADRVSATDSVRRREVARLADERQRGLLERALVQLGVPADHAAAQRVEQGLQRDALGLQPVLAAVGVRSTRTSASILPLGVSSAARQPVPGASAVDVVGELAVEERGDVAAGEGEAPAVGAIDDRGRPRAIEYRHAFDRCNFSLRLNFEFVRSASSAIEDYAKAIYALEQRAAGPVSTNALAERLGVTAGVGVGDGPAARRAGPRVATSPTAASS